MLENASTASDYIKIDRAIDFDFGNHKALHKYLSLIFKENYLKNMYQKMKKNTLLRSVKIKVLIQMFIATIRYDTSTISRYTSLTKNKYRFSMDVMKISPYHLHKYFRLIK